jgi:hypothetical protein
MVIGLESQEQLNAVGPCSARPSFTDQSTVPPNCLERNGRTNETLRLPRFRPTLKWLADLGWLCVE